MLPYPTKLRLDFLMPRIMPTVERDKARIDRQLTVILGHHVISKRVHAILSTPYAFVSPEPIRDPPLIGTATLRVVRQLWRSTRIKIIPNLRPAAHAQHHKRTVIPRIRNAAIARFRIDTLPAPHHEIVGAIEERI